MIQMSKTDENTQLIHTSYAQLLAKLSTAALEAAYTAILPPGAAILAEVDEIKIMRPPVGMKGSAAWVKKKGPRTLVSIISVNMSGVTSGVGVVSPSPALWTTYMAC